ncbi:MAG: TIGR03435 family protein [Terriglobus sp.]
MRTLFPIQLIVLMFVVMTAPRIHAQQASGEAHFETAAIHPSHVTMDCLSIPPPGTTHYEVTCMPLRMLIQIAFHNDYVEGGGHVLDTAYDLRATTPDGVPWNPNVIRPMLRQFLTERFHLATHTNTKLVSGYELVVAASGSKMVAAEVDSSTLGKRAGQMAQSFLYPDRILARGVSTATLAAYLSRPLRSPVVDKTDLHGVYNVELKFAPDSPGPSDFPSIFTAVKEQLGLELKPTKVPVTTLFIDHADDTPTEN